MLSRLYRLLPALLLVGACSSETAILVAVSGSAVEELEFHVGTLINDGTGAYVLDPALSGDRVNVHGRNLRARPYELLLREEDTTGSPLSLRVLALAYKLEEGESKLAGFAITEPPQRFIREEVVRRSISIGWLSETHSVHSSDERNCFSVRSGKEKEQLDLTAIDDRDCDGSLSEEHGGKDCDDEDPAVRPGAAEICDGKDTNCDEADYAPEKFVCYALVNEKCHVGERTCDDKGGKGFINECQPLEEEPAVVCHAFEECGQSCVDKIERRKLLCTAQRTKSGEQCPGGLYELDAGEGASECAWAVVSNVDVSITIKGSEGAGTKDVKGCNVKLAVQAAKEALVGHAVLVVQGEKNASVVEVEVKYKTVEACGPQPLSCVEQ